MKKFLYSYLLISICFCLQTNLSFSQNIALGPGLSHLTQINDTLGVGNMWGLGFHGKYFSQGLPIALGGNISFNGKSFDEVYRYQVYQAGGEVDIFLRKEKIRPYFGFELGVLANYRDDLSIPITNFYIDMNPKIGSIFPLSENTWLDIYAGFGYGTNNLGDFIYIPIGLGLIYDAFK